MSLFSKQKHVHSEILVPNASDLPNCALNTAPPSRKGGNNTRCISYKRAALNVNLIQAPHYKKTEHVHSFVCIGLEFHEDLF